MDKKTEQHVITIINNRLKSEDLFQDGNEIKISHGGEDYTLRITANHKLILTK